MGCPQERPVAGPRPLPGRRLDDHALPGRHRNVVPLGERVEPFPLHAVGLRVRVIGRPVRLVGLRHTDPGLEPRMERICPTPWTRCDREADYRQAWAEFERRLGKKMPEDISL